ncbi:FtsX-like permease family protein [Kribbella sp. CA-253562]|uniref:FtsX-like permease family protein n=1 Tax=Kribbella sp. CA-253562 TaxID=3239942 RepID=UPI003D8B3EAB
MLRMSLGAVRDRWHLFAGALVAVAFGVGLVQSALQVMAATDQPSLPPGLSGLERSRIRDGYAGAATLLGLSVMLAVFLTVFVVSTTFGFAVAQRRRELGLLRLIGAQRGRLRLMLLLEATLLGLLGTAVGVPVGLLGTWAQSTLLIEVGMLPPWFEAPWVQGTVWVAAFVGVGTAVVGASAAAWRASRVSALEAIGDLPRSFPVMTGWRWFWGLSAAGFTVLMVIAAQAAGDFVAALMIALVVMISGSVALSQLSPIVVPVAGRLPSLLLRGHVVTDLARAGVLHAVRRSAATAAPLIVLVGLLAGLWGVFGSLAKAVGEEQRQLITAELVVGGRVADGPGVAARSEQTTVPVTIMTTSGKKKRTTYSEAVGIDPAGYQRTHALRPRKGSLDKLSGATIAIGPGMAVEGYKLGQSVTATIGTRQQVLTVVAIMPETLDVTENFFVPRSLTAGVAGSTETIVRVAPGTSAKELAERLRAQPAAGTGEPSAGREVRTVQEWAEAKAAHEQRDDTGIFAVLMGLAGVYAAVAVVNAVVMAAADRRREFALARMAGLTRRQVIGIATVESLTVVVVGVLLGTVVAGAALAGIAAGTAQTYGVVVVAVPWRLLGLLLAGSLAVVGGASAITAWTTTRFRPVTVLSGRE